MLKISYSLLQENQQENTTKFISYHNRKISAETNVQPDSKNQLKKKKSKNPISQNRQWGHSDLPQKSSGI